MQIMCPTAAAFHKSLVDMPARSLDLVVYVTGALGCADTSEMKATLAECARVLRESGVLLVQGYPEYLPELGVYLEKELVFKYWIAVESDMRDGCGDLPSLHAGILLFSKRVWGFDLTRTRFPHRYCAHCGKTRKDWGGKSHLRNPDGTAISNVWTDLPPADNYTHLSTPVLNTVMHMLGAHGDALEAIRFPSLPFEKKGIIGPWEGIDPTFSAAGLPRHMGDRRKPKRASSMVSELDDSMVNVIHRGDAVEVLKSYPDNSIDLVFADPPYNLNKGYNTYEDGWDEARYVGWCNQWLAEYARVLKPTGSLYVLNLPRWSMYHAAFLNKLLHFQNWIVWDALSEPRGKLMPAHYGLLFYTKRPTGFTFNYDDVSPLDSREYCLRASCIRKRKLAGDDNKEPLTDIWRDIHRIRHRRDRDYHPCQLPDALMDRIIRLSTNPGDVVLDALCGAGTTPVAAAKLGRRYVGVDIDEEYVQITRDKLKFVEELGYVHRESTRRPNREYTKKQLQLCLRDLASKLGHLPTPEDVEAHTEYSPEVFFSLFPTWGKALKAAKLENVNE